MDVQEPLKNDASEEEEEQLENSPVPEVALTVPITDDPTIPVYTFRMWTLGILWCAILAFVNQFFYYRTAPLTVSALTAQVRAHACTKRVLLGGTGHKRTRLWPIPLI